MGFAILAPLQQAASQCDDSETAFDRGGRWGRGVLSAPRALGGKRFSGIRSSPILNIPTREAGTSTRYNASCQATNSCSVIKLLLVLQVATVQLPAPEKTFPEDFTQIRGVRELSDGRVIVSDRLDKGVVVADFTRGTMLKIGRTGSGPAEYRLPTGLSAMPSTPNTP